ncbi:hypothetical protein GPALN_014603 [Globodera pallida]|nr:hypothetical protein GPALN_014603 [Globodera pallida]
MSLALFAPVICRRCTIKQGRRWWMRWASDHTGPEEAVLPTHHQHQLKLKLMLSSLSLPFSPCFLTLLLSPSALTCRPHIIVHVSPPLHIVYTLSPSLTAYTLHFSHSLSLFSYRPLSLTLLLPSTLSHSSLTVHSLHIMCTLSISFGFHLLFPRSRLLSVLSASSSDQSGANGSSV